MFRNAGKPIVFAGASSSGLDSTFREQIECRPPIRHGDLVALAEEHRPRPVLILDGVFSETQAITPTECRDMLRSGWPLFGASSMGALRAADLWPEGMIGVGDVFLGYRTGLLKSDAEVAVALDPLTYEEVTLTGVFVRAAIADLLARKAVKPTDARKMLKRALAIHFLERTPEACNRAWNELGTCAQTSGAALDFLAVNSNNPKVHDARRALAHLLSRIWPLPASVDHFKQSQKCADHDGGLPEVLHIGPCPREDGYPHTRICPACAYAMPAESIFCPECASITHENQDQDLTDGREE